MRILVVALLLGACGNKPPAPPDPEAFETMTPDAKCEATAPRGTVCVEEIMTMQLRQLSGDDELAKEVGAHLDEGPRAKGTEAAAIHRQACLGDRGYADAVFTCWAEPDCTALAACIDRHTRGTP